MHAIPTSNLQHVASHVLRITTEHSTKQQSLQLNFLTHNAPVDSSTNVARRLIFNP